MITYILALVLIVLLAVLANPFMLWMPSVVLVAALTVTVILLFIWAAFILTEQASDEREESNRTLAGRAAYLAAAAVLVAALLYQGLTHTIDPWIPTALIAIVLAKSIAKFYTDTYR